MKTKKKRKKPNPFDKIRRNTGDDVDFDIDFDAKSNSEYLKVLDVSVRIARYLEKVEAKTPDKFTKEVLNSLKDRIRLANSENDMIRQFFSISTLKNELISLEKLIRKLSPQLFKN